MKGLLMYEELWDLLTVPVLPPNVFQVTASGDATKIALPGKDA